MIEYLNINNLIIDEACFNIVYSGRYDWVRFCRNTAYFLIS